MSTKTETYYVLELPSGKQYPVTTREEFTRIVNKLRTRKGIGTGWQLVRRS